MNDVLSDKKRSSATAGLLLACSLGLLLLLLSYLHFAGLIRGSAFHGTKVVAQTLTEPLWRTRLGLNILLFVLAQLALHLAFGGASWLLAAASGRAWPRNRITRRQWVVIWFVLGTLWLLVANASLFPRSSLGAPYYRIAQLGFGRFTLLGLLTAGMAMAMGATLLLAAWRALGPRRMAWLLGGPAVLLIAAGILLRAHAAPAGRTDRPNVILLGIDSLRPDLTTSATAPNMRAFLDRSLQLDDAVTPLARTFPSWVSILTGRHPHTTGAFMNLLPPERIHTGHTLPELLREQGYHTVYGIDETRFSNVDASYGFDRAETPGIGGSDFVLTWFSDAPLSNLLINTRLGALLFPYQYANRAAFVTYEPDTFVRRMERALDTRQPLFLAVHLTLPHWPFVWADPALPPPGETDERRWKYLNTVRRADQQFGDLLAMLERKGLLANAVVVALSDHGETFSSDADFLAQVFPGADDAFLDPQRNGHGTSVFAPGQYHTVLGFRGYGAAAALLPDPHRVAEPVSLLDITPTILDLLHVPAAEPLDGQSLLPLFRAEPGAAARFTDRIRYTESEYNPAGFNVDNMTASAIAAAAMIYRVDPRTDRLKVRADGISTILATRQYAALLGNTMAAAVPDIRNEGVYHFVYLLMNGATGDPRQEARLREALKKRFGVEFGDAARTARSQP